RVFVEERVEHGLWPDKLMIAEVGSNAWRAFRELSPASPAMPAADVAQEPDIAAATSRPAGYAPTSAADHGHNLSAVRAVAEPEMTGTGALPAGPAIHAGFWRRCAAYTIDYFITAVMSYVAGFIAGFGLAAGQGAAGVGMAPMIGGLLGLVITWLYFALQES